MRREVVLITQIAWPDPVIRSAPPSATFSQTSGLHFRRAVNHVCRSYQHPTIAAGFARVEGRLEMNLLLSRAAFRQ
ncbi:MAG: hypothetical protein QOK48_585 [Blastocatellia bacterium]|jgi:hypothetical protein|nr:hypothetical protein [Blastocatellia bacterium]